MFPKFETKPETLPAVEVANEVLWINDDVEMPFNLKKGESAKLGLFLTPEPKTGEKVLNLEVMENHFRSALLGQVIFADKEGRIYRDVDVKGIGGIESARMSETGKLRVQKQLPGSVDKQTFPGKEWGIYDLGQAETDRDVSEELLKRGLRTYRVLGIIELKEIVDGAGNKISKDEAITMGIITDDTKPVIEVRAFGTKARVADASERQSFIEDAKNIVAEEMGERPEDITDDVYLDWFAETLGEQVAILHSNGFVHGFLTSHNITLDSRIVDFDSTFEFYQAKEITKSILSSVEIDIEDSLTTFKNLAMRLYGAKKDEFQSQWSLLKSKFKESYLKEMTKSKFKFASNPEFLKIVEQTIATS